MVKVFCNKISHNKHCLPEHHTISIYQHIWFGAFLNKKIQWSKRKVLGDSTYKLFNN